MINEMVLEVAGIITGGTLTGFVSVVLHTRKRNREIRYLEGLQTDRDAPTIKELQDKAYKALDEVLFGRTFEHVVAELPASVRDDFTPAGMPCPSFLSGEHFWSQRGQVAKTVDFMGFTSSLPHSRTYQPGWSCPCGAKTDDAVRANGTQLRLPLRYDPTDPLASPSGAPDVGHGQSCSCEDCRRERRNLQHFKPFVPRDTAIHKPPQRLEEMRDRVTAVEGLSPDQMTQLSDATLSRYMTARLTVRPTYEEHNAMKHALIQRNHVSAYLAKLEADR